jgi:hypothetical protein
MVRTLIQLREPQAAYLKEQAAAQDISVAELVRKSIDAMMKSPTVASREEIKRRALAAAGTVHSGGKNLAARHDEIFAEACRP